MEDLHITNAIPNGNKIKQTQLSVIERFLRCCQACQRPERLVLVSRTGSVDTQAVEHLVHLL
ncbi:hypothetical protein DPMN_192242 [Dreissena polymorpha]|uniref:Uncharacterized protein n=1 Tax=Dreissena polymorpha TaxID=45954 RepID=A0A9D4BC31_DREPO|nr:hypothetical protein DPMN_192242 [Dreissena polymorpha]